MLVTNRIVSKLSHILVYFEFMRIIKLTVKIFKFFFSQRLNFHT
jgi:hypothetical protein